MDYTLQGAAADSKPPALPIKQRRSHSSTSSAPDLQLEGISNLHGSSPLPSPLTDVFAAPADCNAAQCPIHHHFGQSGFHLGRFFSDQTPPPIPKKRLARTYSLPADNLFKPAPPFLSHQLCRNPGQDKKEENLKFQLTFDTPDQHLPGFFSGFCHQEQVYTVIQYRYLQFMRSTVKHLEAQVLLEEEEVERVRTLRPQDFVLCEEVQSEKTEEDIFFMVNAPKVPEGVFSAKINRKDAILTCSMSQPHHINIEETVAHFSPCMDLEKQLSESLTAAEASESSHEGSAESWQEPNTISKRHTVLSFLERGLAVTIVRDFPWGTLEDFIQEGISLQPEEYERRLCLLILQLALGLQHLESHNVKHAELRPQNVMLVWVHAKNKRSMGKAETVGDLKEQKKNTHRINIATDQSEWESTVPDTPQENRGRKRLQILWRKWGAPRVVITPSSGRALSSQEVPTNGLQLGVLLKHCLHEYTDVHKNTPYTSGLLHLINRLTRENPELQMSEIAGVLQALLWGPRAGLFERNQPNTTVLHNWLMVKRSLLVLKLAEKGLFSNQSGLDWENYFCLHYLSFADPETVLKTTAQLGLYNNVRLV
ncbi:inactive tyrosine-protein kinase PEAK1 isoform X1 [Astyanax mexicanus]|uniref:Pseudopodium-enriched atypical kinase 1-like isoform X1 n=1 Tax=Astyanax mexicanus TaxID=7994 RepID=A0A8T2L5F6_ASTMX|nr:inactive tyrosine-protein kinase PEAK1 isoform X1 [Astyanax mexicanus]KAG9266833.1 pseudopodium-enriched atypical kinase 1-like isoform X1 [Astyanax mexicanus]